MIAKAKRKRSTEEDNPMIAQLFFVSQKLQMDVGTEFLN